MLVSTQLKYRYAFYLANVAGNAIDAHPDIGFEEDWDRIYDMIDELAAKRIASSSPRDDIYFLITFCKEYGIKYSKIPTRRSL